MTNGCDARRCINPATHYHEMWYHDTYDGVEKLAVIEYACEQHKCVDCVAL